MPIKKGWKPVVGGVLILLLAGAAAIYWLQQPPGEITLRPDDEKLVARGAAIYEKYCASCHGKILQGQPEWRMRLPNGRLPAPPHDQTGHTWHHPDKLLFRLTKEGPAVIAGGGYESDMPGYEGTLSDKDIVAVLSFIKSTWPAAIKARHDAINRRQR